MALTEVQERIVAAAAECFRARGVAATRMEHVAAEVGLARPNLYRHFSSKEELVLHVILRETRQAHRDRAAIARRGPVGALIVRGMVLGQELAHANPFIRSLLAEDAVALTASIVSGDSELLDVQAEFWGPLLSYGRRRGEIREDLGDAEIVRWLTSMQFLMVERPAWFGGEAGLRAAVERFIVPALLSSAGSRPTSAGRSGRSDRSM